MPGIELVLFKIVLVFPCMDVYDTCVHEGFYPCTRGGCQVYYSNTVHLIPLRQSLI